MTDQREQRNLDRRGSEIAQDIRESVVERREREGYREQRSDRSSESE